MFKKLFEGQANLTLQRREDVTAGKVYYTLAKLDREEVVEVDEIDDHEEALEPRLLEALASLNGDTSETTATGGDQAPL